MCHRAKPLQGHTKIAKITRKTPLCKGPSLPWRQSQGGGFKYVCERGAHITVLGLSVGHELLSQYSGIYWQKLVLAKHSHIVTMGKGTFCEQCGLDNGFRLVGEGGATLPDFLQSNDKRPQALDEFSNIRSVTS